MTARDIIFVAVAVASIALVFFVMHYSYGTIADILVNNSIINESQPAIDAIADSKELTNRFDYVIFSVFIALAFAVIITGWFVGGNAIFMFIYFLVVVIAVVIAAILNNVWAKFMETTAFVAANTVANFPLTDALLSQFPLYIGIVGFLGIIVMFAKSAIGGGRE